MYLLKILGDKMKINIFNLNTEIKKLNKLIEEYEDTYLNLYNELSSNEVYWNDNISKKFNENIRLEKIQVRTSIDELTSIKNIYEEIVFKYEKIGNKLAVIPKTKNTILTKLDNYSTKLHQILEIYNEIDTTKKSKEILIINNHINKFKKMALEISALRRNIKEKYELIEEIENSINLKISKIKIDYIQEIDINKFI